MARLAEVVAVRLTVSGADAGGSALDAGDAGHSAVRPSAPLITTSTVSSAFDSQRAGFGVGLPDSAPHDAAPSASGFMRQIRSFLELPAAGTDSIRACLVAALAAASQPYPAAAEAR